MAGKFFMAAVTGHWAHSLSSVAAATAEVEAGHLEQLPSEGHFEQPESWATDTLHTNATANIKLNIFKQFIGYSPGFDFRKPKRFRATDEIVAAPTGANHRQKFLRQIEDFCLYAIQQFAKNLLLTVSTVLSQD